MKSQTVRAELYQPGSTSLPSRSPDQSTLAGSSRRYGYKEVSFMTVRFFSFFSVLLSLTELLPLSDSYAEAQQATISSFSLIRADTGEVLRDGISGFTELNLSSLPSKKLSIRANTSPSIVRKVIFTLNGSKTAVDSASPYALFGDDGGRSLHGHRSLVTT
jgi:hypothetical protein